MTTSTTPRVLLDGLSVVEAPRWHDGRLYFSDFYNWEVVAVDLDGARETIAEVRNQPSGLGWLPDGALLIVSMRDRKLLRRDESGLAEVVDLSPSAPFAVNDMVVDGGGRAYISSLGRITPTENLEDGFWEHLLPVSEWPDMSVILACDTGDGWTSRIVADGFKMPNGLVVTPDGRTLVVADTFGGLLVAFDIQEDGSLTGRRVWANLGSEAHPDGICLDAEGCVWAATPTAFVRVAEGGVIKGRIDVADGRAFAGMLGGPDGRTLFMTQSRSLPGGGPEMGSGKILMAEVAAPAAGFP